MINLGEDRKNNVIKLIKKIDNPELRLLIAINILNIEEFKEIVLSEIKDYTSYVNDNRIEKDEYVEYGYIEILKFAIKLAPIENLVKMAIEKNDIYAFDVIIKRIIEGKDLEIIGKNIHQLSRINNNIARVYEVRILPIYELMEIAIEEKNYDVVDVIIKRLEENKDTEEVKKNAYKLAKAKNIKIRLFAVKIISISDLMKIAIKEENYDVVDAIIKRLEENKDTEEVKKNAYKLAKARNIEIRLFAVKIVSIDELIEIAVKEQDNYLEDVIIKRFEENKDTEELKKNAYKLAKANNMKARLFYFKLSSINDIIKITNDDKEKKIVQDIIKLLN